jgi:hypothetical protein
MNTLQTWLGILCISHPQKRIAVDKIRNRVGLDTCECIAHPSILTVTLDSFSISKLRLFHSSFQIHLHSISQCVLGFWFE